MDLRVIYKGKFSYLVELKRELNKVKVDLVKISNILKKNLYNFGVIIESNNFSFAATDRINSYPIFYEENQNKPNFIINNCLTKNSVKDENNLNEFMCAGYNCFDRTIFEKINKLQSSEFIFYKKKTKRLIKKFYFLFLPNYKKNKKTIKETRIIFEKVFQRMNDQIKNKPVCLFLSAGLDSRLLACKLHEMGKQDITFISYGINNNFESNEAKKVAKTLGAAWYHINPNTNKCRKIFNSKIIEEYWQSGDNFSSFLSLREFFVLKEIKDKNIISDDSIIMNGQSGDFITGGHTGIVDKNLKNLNLSKLSDIIIKKHFSINTNYLNKRVRNLILKDIQYWVKEFKLTSQPKELLRLYEFWEWIERQTKYVTQSVRAYEFFNYKWLMPLWDFELIDYWKNVPLIQKKKQNLYIDYLKDYNYKNLFRNYRRTQSQFPIQYKWLIIFGNIAHLLFGRSKKENFYKIMQYYGQYNHQYKVYSLSEFMRNYKIIKNPLSLFLNTWKERRLD